MAFRFGRWQMQRPRLVPTLMTACAVPILIGLGVWQVDRLGWKQGLIAEREEALARAPIALHDALDEDAGLVRVEVTGEFDHAREVELVARTYRGRNGVDILAPLMLDDGRVILVNRGWVSEDYRDPELRPESRPEGEVRLTGTLHPPEEPGFFTPDNDPDAGVWFYTDVERIAGNLDLDFVTDRYLMAAPDSEGEGGSWPVPRATDADLPNPHLEYALTWFSLAAIAMGFWIAFHMRRDDEDSS